MDLATMDFTRRPQENLELNAFRILAALVRTVGRLIAIYREPGPRALQEVLFPYLDAL